MDNPPLQENFGRDPVPRGWQQWFIKVGNYAGSNADSGTTANRPIMGLWIGRPYFDTSLGYSINVKTTSPIVWVNGAGAAV